MYNNNLKYLFTEIMQFPVNCILQIQISSPTFFKFNIVNNDEAETVGHSVELKDIMGQ